MATVVRHIPARPQRIFTVLADGWSYANWVVGTSHMRAVGADWPAVGSRLQHASGVWPLVFRDETVVEVCEPSRRLVLLAKGRPLGEARVELLLAESGDGTDVTMVETPVRGPGHWLHNRATDAVLTRRNVESLARLAALAENRTAS